MGPTEGRAGQIDPRMAEIRPERSAIVICEPSTTGSRHIYCFSFDWPRGSAIIGARKEPIMKRTLQIGAMLAALFALPLTGSAQSITAADAAPFLGAWTLMLETPQGAMPMTVSVKNSGGKITGEMGSDMMPSQSTSNISKDGASLLMKYNFDFQGQAIPAALTLTPAEGKMNFSLDFADGQFLVSGEATKQQ